MYVPVYEYNLDKFYYASILWRVEIITGFNINSTSIKYKDKLSINNVFQHVGAQTLKNIIHIHS